VNGRRRLRIALALESDGIGGAEIVLLNLALALRARGHEVVHIGPQHGCGWLGTEFRNADFETATFSIRRALDFSALSALVGTYRRLGIDVIHSHEFTMAVYGGVAGRFLRTPHIVTFHGGRQMSAALRRRIALRWAIQNSAATVAVSEGTRAQLSLDLGIASTRVAVVWNGVPRRSGSPESVRQEIGWSQGELVVLAVGNLEPWKGHRLLIQALAGKGLASLPWRLVIAGGRGGSEHHALESLAAELGVADRVHLLMNREDVPSLLAAADVFAMPSLTEGLPMALLEAMMCGRAVIASNIGGIPEAVTSGETGLLVPTNDVPTLAAALHRVLVDHAERARLGSAAQRRAELDFASEAMAANYERIYLS
jgi:glycosyltransferase involved in cell wall biosynthesis